MSKVVKYTYRLRRYNYTHNQLNILDISVSFLRFFFEGGRKIQVCPRAPVTLATPLITGFNRGVQIIFPEVYNNDGTDYGGMHPLENLEK